MELCCWARVTILRRKKPQTRPRLRLQANEDLVPAMASPSSAVPFREEVRARFQPTLMAGTPFKKVAVAKDWASRCPEATVVAVVQSTP